MRTAPVAARSHAAAARAAAPAAGARAAGPGRRTTASAALALLTLLLAACAAGEVAPRQQQSPVAGAGQLVLVTSEGWDSDQGVLRAFQRHHGQWRQRLPPTPVVLGRSGVAWGLGLHPAQPGLQKREGDGRNPAGAFALGPAFGYASADATALQYLPMRHGHWCMDVPGSPHYNRIVDALQLGATAVAGSTEPMRLDLHGDGDQRYRLGVVVQHNAAAVAGAGSCIFMHLWKAPGVATSGCTAMDEASMRALLDWLDPTAAPVLVLLPQAEYLRLQRQWQLPEPAGPRP